AEHAITALRAGKQVFLEKPMALSETDCAAINQACTASGRQLMVGHVLRWFEPYRAIAAAYRSGQLGRALHGSFWRLEHDFLQIAPWKGQRAGSGGYLFEVAAHELDWLRSVFGEPRSVAADIDKRPPSMHELEDRVALQLVFADDFGVHYLGGTGFSANSHGFCLRFEHATIESDAAFDPARIRITQHGAHPITLDFSPTDPYRAELDAWLDSLAQQQAMPVSGADAAATVALIASAYRAAGW
ncbi:MAG TPA: Gfo/Idh/MocA family oxidoreductase, partial [Chitinolyticbacter sp.]|nr:Gfo/Idh/MocA family oxidoreductase [Chitinolyticbacter sp.]